MATGAPDKILPHSDDAERSVLGAVLLDNRHLDRALEVLGPDDFYSIRHQKMLRAIEAMAERNTAVDLVTLKDELTVRGDLDDCGGVGYLATLVNGVPRSANVEHYAKIVKERSVQRSLIRATQQILSQAMDPEGGSDELLDEAEKAIFGVAENRLSGGFIPLAVSAEESLAKLEELTRREELVTGVPTGFPQLDEYTAGLQPSDLIIIAARPAMGKTSFAMNLACHAAMHNKKVVGVFSLEMSHHQLFMRLLCSEGQVDAHRLRTGRISKDDWQRIIKIYGPLSESPMYIDDTPGVTIMEMRAKCRRLARERGLDLVIVDYLQLMRGRGRYDSRQQEISDISRSLKELAKELNVPLIALSQLSRAPETRGKGEHRPQLSDLRESGAIEQDADVVMFLFREEVYNKEDPELQGKAEVIIGKQRNGPTETVHLNFIRKYTRFANPEFREF